MAQKDPNPLVSIIMGSKSDWETMQHASQTLSLFAIPHECRVISAHRTPQVLADFAAKAESRGVRAIIAAAGGAAHLAGVTAAQTIVPVLGVPIQSPALQGLDSLLSIVQMPGGIPVATFAIGKAGAVNAALFSVQILSGSDMAMREKFRKHRLEQGEKVLKDELP